MRGSLTGSFLRLTGGTLTGDLVIQKQNPRIRLDGQGAGDAGRLEWYRDGAAELYLEGNPTAQAISMGDLAPVQVAFSVDVVTRRLGTVLIPPPLLLLSEWGWDQSFFDDDFNGGITSGGNVGEQGWGNNFSGTAGLASLGALADHPGGVQMSTGATINSFCTLRNRSVAAGIVVPTNLYDLTWIFRANMADANTGYNIGLADTDATQNPTNGVYLQKLPADVNLFFVNRAGGIQTRQDSGIAADANWHRLRIRSIAAGANFFTLDTAAEVNLVGNDPTAAVSAQAVLTNSAAANKTLDVDFFSMVMTLARQP